MYYCIIYSYTHFRLMKRCVFIRWTHPVNFNEKHCQKWISRYPSVTFLLYTEYWFRKLDICAWTQIELIDSSSNRLKTTSILEMRAKRMFEHSLLNIPKRGVVFGQFDELSIRSIWVLSIVYRAYVYVKIVSIWLQWSQRKLGLSERAKNFRAIFCSR